MAVASTTRKQQFTLNGTTSTLTFTFRALVSAPTDIKVTVTSGAGVDSDLVYTTDFTVAINSDGIGGTVTLVSPSSVGSGTATVYRDTTNTQESDYDNYNQFPADTVETDFDIRTLVSQEQSEAIDRILQLPISYSGTASTILPTPVASTILGWNSAGSALENKTASDFGAVVGASQAEAEAGTSNTVYMTPLRAFQAIAAKLLALAAAVNFAKGADIASASTTNIGAATGNSVDVTGTVTITALGTVQAGTQRVVRFTGILILTHNASSLILPTGANITTQAGDVAKFISLGSGNWYCASYQRKDGTALVASTPTVAAQSDMETPSSNTLMCTPLGIKWHPGVPKAWVAFTGTGTVTIRSSHNVTSITDNGTGDYTVNLTTAFSSTQSTCVVTGLGFNEDTSFNPRTAEIVRVSTSAVRLVCGSESGGVDDQASVYFMATGDQ